MLIQCSMEDMGYSASVTNTNNTTLALITTHPAFKHLRIIPQFPTIYAICEAIIEQFKLFSGLDGILVTTMHKITKGIYDVFVCICQVI